MVLGQMNRLSIVIYGILCFTVHAISTFPLDIPPRIQWNANYGYCGEVSLISAGLYYGQYSSQFTARAIASPKISQNKEGSQLLLGVNANTAAAAMRLNYSEWNTDSQTSTEGFLTWMKEHVRQSHPVVIAVFTNEYKFDGDTDENAGDSEYDHIVPVTGVSGNPNQYSNSDVVTFSDNGIWAPNKKPQFIFQSKFGDFARSRSDANAEDSPVYSLNNNKQNYGIAITGVQDVNSDTVPVRLTTQSNAEVPSLKDGSSRPPKPAQLKLKATVKIPDQTVAYNLYLYNDFARVPESNFNLNAGKASRVWSIPAHSGQEYTVQLNILSNEMAIFRAVRQTAP